MQIDRNDPVSSHRGNHGGGYLGGDRHPGGTGPAILAGISEIRDDRRDAGGRRAFHGVDHDQQFHEIIRRRRTCGLDDVDVTATDIVHHLDHDFAVAEAPDNGSAHGHIEFVSNAARQPQVCVTRENHQ